MSDKNAPGKTFEGMVSITMRGSGFFSNPDLEKDIFLPPENLNTALHGDTVTIRITDRIENKRQIGEVVRVTSRAKLQFVGTLEQKEGAWYLKSDDRRMYRPLRVTEGIPSVLEHDMKALVVLTAWESPTKDPEGKLVTIIGKKGEHETEMRSIVLGRGFDLAFNDALEKEAKAIEANKAITPEEIARRRDFRGISTSTIDPADAKDFDDALSMQVLPNGNIEVGIHIADVSHYVKLGSAIDDEARERGTSIYLVDRTIPMLPEVLSNDVCSLNPNEDKLTYSAVFELTSDGTIQGRWFGKTVIHSNKRFAYEEAQRVIDTGEGPMVQELRLLNDLAKKIKEKRFKNGAIDFDQPEIKFQLDASGRPTGVIKKDRLDVHKLIEEFMLLANKEVATHMAKLKGKASGAENVFVYRVHDIPDPERMEDLVIFIKALGYDLDAKDGIVSAKELNRLFKELDGKPEETLIKTATIRSMSRAIYTTKNIGHFGLAFEYYTHFTSPIRRYPDIMVHRMLKKHFDGEKLSHEEIARYEHLAMQSSEREVSAAEAERDSIKLKQVEYMANHVGKIFEGVISGITEWGMYVEEKETLAEGMIRLGALKDDFYELDKKNFVLIGQRTKRRFRLGDPIKVKLMGVNTEDRTIDWQLVTE